MLTRKLSKESRSAVRVVSRSKFSCRMSRVVMHVPVESNMHNLVLCLRLMSRAYETCGAHVHALRGVPSFRRVCPACVRSPQDLFWGGAVRVIRHVVLPNTDSTAWYSQVSVADWPTALPLCTAPHHDADSGS